MLSYCLKCKEIQKVKILKLQGLKTEMFLSKYAVCNSKKSKCLKEKEPKGLLSNLTRMKIPVLSDFLLSLNASI